MTIGNHLGETGRVRAAWIDHGPAALKALAEQVDAAKGGDPLARVTVVVPTKVSGLGLRRTLSSRPAGSVGVDFVVAAQLAEQLGAQRLAESAQQPLTPLVRAELVREALRRSPGSLGDLAAHPATAYALDRAMSTVREATATTGEPELLAELDAAGGARASLAAAHRTFRQLTAQTRYDEHDLALAAADAVTERPDLVAGVGPVVVHLPTRATPAVGDLLQALAAHTSVTVLLGRTGDAQADRATRAVGRRLTDCDVPAPSTTPAEPADDAPPPDAAHLPVQALVVPDADEEVRQAARIVARALHAGDDLSRMAVLYRAQEPYATLVAEHFAAADLPHNGPTSRTIRQTLAGRFLWDLMRWAEDGHPRAGLFDVIGSVPVRWAGGRAPAERWDRVARRARVLGGVEQWDRRLAGFARQCQVDADYDTPRRDRHLRHAETARELRDFVLGLAEALQGPSEATWAGWSQWALDLLDTHLGRSRRGWPADDIDAEGVLRQRLVALAQLDDLQTERGITDAPVGVVAAREAIELALDEPATRVGRAGVGVHVGPIGSAGTLDLDHAIVLGATDGQFPPRVRDRAFLPDVIVHGIREQATPGTSLPTAAGALPTSGDQIAPVRQALHRVVAGSRRTTFTVPRADRREQRSRLPAPWLLELLSRQANRRVTVEDLLEHPADVPGVHAVDSPVAGLHAAEVPAGVAELRLRLLADHAAAGTLADDTLVAQTPALATGVQALAARRGETFTSWDGHIAGVEQELGERLARPKSAGALADYATCPRRFLFTHLLGVRTEEEPRQWLDVDALDRGDLIHTTLERWVGETLDGVPPAADGAPPGTEERLFELFDAQATQLEATGRTGLPLLWQLEKRRMRRRLQRWLVEDEQLRNEHGVEPVAVELAFGMAGDDGEPPLEVPTAAGVTLSLRGKIDRVDRSPDGDRVVVTDYKTGKVDRYRKLDEDITLQGAELQATVYGLVAARDHPEAAVEVGYWHVGDTPRNVEPGLVAFDEQARARSQQVLDTIAAGVTGGVFPAVPGAESLWPQPHFEHCRFCPFDTICPSHAERARAARRDLAAPASRVLLPLWEPTDGTDAEEES